MPKIALGSSTRGQPREAAREAAESVADQLDGGCASAVVLVSTASYGGEKSAGLLLDEAQRVLGTDTVVGAGLEGLMVGGHEWRGEPAVAALAFSDAEADLAFVDEVAGRERELGEELQDAFGPMGPEDFVVLFADPLEINGQALAHGLTNAGPARIAGVAAALHDGEVQPTWAGAAVGRGAVAALRVRHGGDAGVRIAVTEACRTIRPPAKVTRSQGHWVLGLDGRPALDVFREAIPAPLRDDLPRAARSVFVALSPDETSSCLPGRRRVRNVVGFDPKRGGFSVAEAPATGSSLELVALDSQAAREDFDRLGSENGDSGPEGVLYFNCRERAERLFSHEGYELGRLAGSLGQVPTLGMIGSHLYARPDPQARCELLTYAGLAAMFVPRKASSDASGTGLL